MTPHAEDDGDGERVTRVISALGDASDAPPRRTLDAPPRFARSAPFGWTADRAVGPSSVSGAVVCFRRRASIHVWQQSPRILRSLLL